MVSIGGKQISSDYCFLIAEIGINANGDVNLAKKMIDHASQYGFDAVKFQKRTIDIVYSAEELARPRDTPFGKTNGDLKRGLEFGLDEYAAIDRYCKKKNILWFASPWDEPSVDFLEQFDVPCYKVASALLTDHSLLKKIRDTNKPVILSTGMSTLEEIDEAVEILGWDDLVILHCNSTYPSPLGDINLAVIDTLREKYDCEIPIGYSGHEPNVTPSVMAVAGFGAAVVERHITLDRSMFGTDQPASLAPEGMRALVTRIRMWPVVKGNEEKVVHPSEIPIKKKLRRV